MFRCLDKDAVKQCPIRADPGGILLEHWAGNRCFFVHNFARSLTFYARSITCEFSIFSVSGEPIRRAFAHFKTYSRNELGVSLAQLVKQGRLVFEDHRKPLMIAESPGNGCLVLPDGSLPLLDKRPGYVRDDWSVTGVAVRVRRRHRLNFHRRRKGFAKTPGAARSFPDYCVHPSPHGQKEPHRRFLNRTDADEYRNCSLWFGVYGYLNSPLFGNADP